MAFTHGKDTYISINSVDLSAFCNTSTFTRGGNKHDTTTYGKDDEVFSAGLGKGSFSCGGIYDNGSSGPRDTLEPLVNTVTTLVRRPEGTGSGLPQDSVSIYIDSYVETSPVNDMVSWSLEATLSDAVTSTNQA